MPQSTVRVPGGGNTYVVIGTDNYNIELLAEFTDTPGRLLGNFEDIIPIGYRHPLEIVTPYSQTSGTISLVFWEQWGEDGWVSGFMHNGSIIPGGPWLNDYNPGDASTLGLGKPIDLVQVMEAQRENPDYITVKKVELGADGSVARVKVYNKCVISDINVGSNRITQTLMTSQCTVTMKYTDYTVVRGSESGISTNAIGQNF